MCKDRKGVYVTIPLESKSWTLYFEYICTKEVHLKKYKLHNLKARGVLYHVV